MPGPVIAARVILFILGVVVLLWSTALFLFNADLVEPPFEVRGLIVTLAVVTLVLGLLSILAAALFGQGGAGVRAFAVVLGSLYALLGLASLLFLVGGALVLVFTAGSWGRDWFNRPRAQGS